MCRDEVVFLSLSTSNHNAACNASMTRRLYFFPYLHQTTTSTWLYHHDEELYFFPYLHQTTTWTWCVRSRRMLYFFPYLHQTTTAKRRPMNNPMLYFFPYLHQTTTATPHLSPKVCCISFLIYIKPQLLASRYRTKIVVFLSLSTSNHNLLLVFLVVDEVVFLSLSTSNHNST